MSLPEGQRFTSDATHALDSLSKLSGEDPIAALTEYRLLHEKITRQEAAVIAAARKIGHDDAAIPIALRMQDEEKYPTTSRTGSSTTTASWSTPTDCPRSFALENWPPTK
jgi:hypothetical protein